MSESEETADTKVEKVAETAKSEEGEAPPAAAEEPQSTGETETKVQPRFGKDYFYEYTAQSYILSVYFYTNILPVR